MITWPNTQAAPILKWAGGKRRLLTQYRAHFPTEFGAYYEPFFGGGAVFFWLHSQGLLEEKKVWLNDINPDLVNLYRTLATECEQLIEKLTIHKRKHDHDYYYAIRAKNKARMQPVNRAARLIYLNRTCFNGLYRVNSRGEFNVPMGRYKNPLICDPVGLRLASLALQKASFSQGSFSLAVESATRGDLVYFDPPYVPLNTTSNFTSYSKENFGLREQEQLAETFRKLAERGVQVLLSNSDTPLVRELYKDFQQHRVMAGRAINSNANRRQKVAELLIQS